MTDATASQFRVSIPNPGIKYCLTANENIKTHKNLNNENLFVGASKAATVNTSARFLNVVDRLTANEDLSFFGFRLFPADQVVTLRSPTEILPMLPVFMGSNYQHNVRGGLFIESHGLTGPTHFWMPKNENCGGSVLAAKLLSCHGHEFEFQLARIEIPFGQVLICASDAWHCDGLLMGVFLTSFGYPKGADGSVKNEVTTFQPLLNSQGQVISGLA